MQINKIIGALEGLIKDPAKGLPEEVFLFASRIVPLINVDLLIKNNKRTLMTWRDDGIVPYGWHIPGGMIRYRETFSDRIKAVAELELGAKVKHGDTPIAIYESIYPALKNRSHGISLLFECSLISPPAIKLKSKGVPKKGQWAWHKKCPQKIVFGQEMYRKYI